MSATRIVGIICAAYPIVTKVFREGWNGLRDWRGWWQRYRSAVALTIAAASGAILFFVYCQLRWGHWDMYMLTQSAGWGITPDYLAVFKPSSYRWLLPALNNPTEMSQMAMTIGALLFVVMAICEFLPVGAAPQHVRDAGRHLFLRRRDLLHFRQRRGLRRDGKHAALRAFASTR